MNKAHIDKLDQLSRYCLLALVGLALALAFVGSGASPAQAASGQNTVTGGDPAGSGGSCSGISFGWRVFGNTSMNASPDRQATQADAWNAFSSLGTVAGCEGYGVASIPAGIRSECQKSYFIWAMVANGNSFVYNGRSTSNNRTAAMVNSSLAGGGGTYYQQRRTAAVNAVNAAYGPEYSVTLICSYEYIDNKIDPTMPVLNDCNSAHRYGSISIPDGPSTDNTRYYKGAGTSEEVPKGQRVTLPETGTVKIHQEATGSFEMAGTAGDRTWDFSSPNTCINERPPTMVGCEAGNPDNKYGYIQIPSNGEGDAEFQRYTRGSDSDVVARGSKVYFTGPSQNINISTKALEGYKFLSGVQKFDFPTFTADSSCPQPGEVPSTEPPLNPCGMPSPQFGSVTIPSGAVTNNTTYRLGSATGTVLTKGSTINFTSNTHSITIFQVANSGYTFPGQGASVSWVKDAPGDWDCRTDVVNPESPSFNPTLVTTSCPGQTYRNGSGTITIPSTNSSKLTWRLRYPNGTTSVVSPGAISVTGGGTYQVSVTANSGYTIGSNPGPWSFTFTIDSAPSGTCNPPTTVWDYDSDSSSSCTNGSDKRDTQTTTMLDPQPYNWRTFLQDAGPRPGATALDTNQHADKLSPLGRLLTTNSNATSAQINAAIAANATAPHAVIDELNQQNREAIAEGGVVNVTEAVTYATVTLTDTFEETTPWTACTTTTYYKRRYRQEQTIQRPNPTTYESRTRTYTPATSGTAAYWSWERRTRSREGASGTVCGYENVPGWAKGDNGWTDERNNCGGGKKNYDYGRYTDWSGWNPQTGSTPPGNCPAGGNEVFQVQNCVNHPATSGTPESYGNWTGWSDTGSCSPNTMTYQCQAKPTTYTSVLQYQCPPGTWYDANGSNACWTSWTYYGTPTQTTNTSYGTPTYVYKGTQSSYTTSQPNFERTWQILSNHCNGPQFNSATQVAERIDNGAGWNKSAAATSAVTSPAGVKWGAVPANSLGTNAVGFYDKQCAYEGRRSPGEDAEDYSTVYFRDNTLETVEVDVYEPDNGGLVSYSGEPALATMITRWAPGTPNPGTTVGGGLRGMTSNGIPIFKNSTQAPPVLKNYTKTQSASGMNWALLDGEHSDLFFGGNWASEAGKPNVFFIKWEYAPYVDSMIPVRNVGYGAPGGGKTFAADFEDTRVQGQVYGKVRGVMSPARRDDLYDSTGSGVSSNPVDGNLARLEGAGLDARGRWTMDPSLYSDYYYTFKYIRAVGS